MKEDNSIFLKVDSVEPVYNLSPFPCLYSSEGEPYLKGIKVLIGGEGHFFECDRYTVCGPDIVREDGRQQVVALVKELMAMTITDKNDIFGYSTSSDIITHFSYEEITKKLDVWKEKKETIHIKDEVQHKENGDKAVILNVQDGFIYAVTKKKAFITCAPISDYKKTGLHVDDLDSYLEV